LLRRETAWLKNGLFSLLFVYFGVHSTAMHSKISLNQKKNPLFLISGAPVATSLLDLDVGQYDPGFPTDTPGQILLKLKPD
jgi:hypothetical protein